MTKEQEFFIELLSSHINGYIPKPQENIDWKEIFDLSNKHNVTAIVATQIKLLPESSRVQGKVNRISISFWEKHFNHMTKRLKLIIILLKHFLKMV